MQMKIYRLLIVLAVVSVTLIYYFYPCLMLNIKDFPSYNCTNAGIKRIIILYGAGICDSCSTGRFIRTLEDKKNVLFVVSGDYSDNDMENLRDTFKLEGMIIRGGEDTDDFLKDIAGCKRIEDWRKNYFVTLKSNKKLDTIKEI